MTWWGIPMKTREQMIADCQGLVRSLAWQIHCKLPPHVDLEDLVSYGQIGLLEAVKNFDPEREIQFTTFSYHRIRGAIFDGLSKMSWFNQASFNGGVYERQRAPAVPAGPSREKLAADYQALVRTLAWQIHVKLPATVELSELVAAGQAGLDKAVQEVGRTGTQQLSTLTYRYIQEAIFQRLSRFPWFDQADFNRGAYSLAQNTEQEPPTEEPQNPHPAEEVASPSEAVTADPAVVRLVQVICHSFADGNAESAGEQLDVSAPPDREAMQREMIEQLHLLIGQLPEPEQALIRATYFEGQTLKEAGQKLGISKAWASRLHSRTLERLARSFRQAKLLE